jgi:O-antigen/teichoic acid export membrane protein
VSKSSHRDLAASIGKNTVFGIIARVTQLATRLVTIPIVITHLGLDGYGIWSIVMTTAAYMRFGSVGIKSAFQKYVAEAVENEKFEVANSLLSTGCAFMLILSIAGLVPAALLSRQLAEGSGVPPQFLSSSSKAIFVLALIMVFSNVGAVYESIVMGGHRIDLARKFTTFFCVAEAIAIVGVLHLGFGLFGMACIMATSEVGFIVCCWIASRKVVPSILVARPFVTVRALRELVRFAGTYQLRSILEVLYLAIAPITILRTFGAQSAGVYALSARLLSTATTATDAFLLPILTGGTAVFTAGSVVAMRALVVKSFKVTLALGLLPLAFMSVFGTTLIYAWTGQTDPSLRAALWLVCISGLWQALSILGIVLYRVSGSVILDNVQQLLRIVIVLAVALFAQELHFIGALAGLAFAEFVGALFILHALSKTFEGFSLRLIFPDAVRIGVATATIIGLGFLTTYLPLPVSMSGRVAAGFELMIAFATCVLATWPALWLTRAFSEQEAKTLLRAILPRRMQAAIAAATT